MYIINGICYAGEFKDDIEIDAVKPLDDMLLLITFSSGETRLFDATCLTGPVFEPLKDNLIFKNAKVENGIVCWQEGQIDCAPEFMYAHSFEYETVNV